MESIVVSKLIKVNNSVNLVYKNGTYVETTPWDGFIWNGPGYRASCHSQFINIHLHFAQVNYMSSELDAYKNKLSPIRSPFPIKMLSILNCWISCFRFVHFYMHIPHLFIHVISTFICVQLMLLCDMKHRPVSENSIPGLQTISLPRRVISSSAFQVFVSTI
jgi:hypothetical protein